MRRSSSIHVGCSSSNSFFRRTCPLCTESDSCPTQIRTSAPASPKTEGIMLGHRSRESGSRRRQGRRDGQQACLEVSGTLLRADEPIPHGSDASNASWPRSVHLQVAAPRLSHRRHCTAQASPPSPLQVVFVRLHLSFSLCSVWRTFRK